VWVIPSGPMESDTAYLESLVRRHNIGITLGILFSPHLFGQCGVERWQAKTGTDSDAGSVNLSSSTPNTIANFTALAKPSTIPPTSRIQPTETTLWSLNTRLTEFKLEGDSDIHLVIIDENGNSMIAEIPDHLLPRARPLRLFVVWFVSNEDVGACERSDL
jgi:hypothetical protein